VRLPRDVGGEDLVKLLGKYGYQVVRQTGSHIRLVSAIKGKPHRITVPRHKPRLGTLDSTLREVARYLEMDKRELIRELWGE